VTGSVITFSAGSDSGSVAPAFALAKSAAISSALSWRFGSLFIVSATASPAAGLGSTTGSGSGTCGASLTGSGSGTCGILVTIQ
jgi:nucleoside recognition membrane protein YjiH